MAVTEVPPLSDEQTQVPGTEEPRGKQMRIDGMPVTQHKVQITGGVTVSEDLMKTLKLGKSVTITVACIVDSRKDKVVRNFDEATGDVKRQIVLAVVDIVEDEDAE